MTINAAILPFSFWRFLFVAASLSTQTPVCWVWRCLTVQETPHPKHLVGSKWYSWQPGFQKNNISVCVLMTLCSARHGTCVLMTLCSARHGTCVLMSLCLARHGTCVPMSLCLARHGTWHLTIGVMCDCVCVCLVHCHCSKHVLVALDFRPLTASQNDHRKP